MLRTRVMPCLLLQDSKLVKTIKFKNPEYVGDPINAVMIYNEKEVDELIFLDVTATIDGKRPPFRIISEIATECFMPFTYGGGITNIEDVKEIFKLGVEKIAINTHAVKHPEFITQIAETNGSQSVVVAIDVKKTWSGYKVFTKSGTKNTGLDPAEWAKEAERRGAGEMLLTSIDNDGTMEGYDYELISKVAKVVRVPVIACGGAGKIEHFRTAVDAGASAVAAGSMVVYHGAVKGVLINFPKAEDLRRILD